MSQKLSRLTINLPVSEHKRLKTAASKMDITMTQLVMMSVDDFMKKKLNKVTEKALRQSKAGKNVKKFDTLEELFEDLGI